MWARGWPPAKSCGPSRRTTRSAGGVRSHPSGATSNTAARPGAAEWKPCGRWGAACRWVLDGRNVRSRCDRIKCKGHYGSSGSGLPPPPAFGAIIMGICTRAPREAGQRCAARRAPVAATLADLDERVLRAEGARHDAEAGLVADRLDHEDGVGILELDAGGVAAGLEGAPDVVTERALDGRGVDAALQAAAL